MSARDVVNSMVGGSHPPEVWRVALDGLVKETRGQVATEIRSLRKSHEANSTPGNVDAMRYRAGLTDAAYIAEGTYPNNR